MPSGMVGTAQYNTSKMIMFANDWLERADVFGLNKKGDDWELPKPAQLAMIAAGVQLKIVTVTRLGATQEEILANKFLNLDFLGFNALNVAEIMGSNKFVPILDHERLMKALMFNKKNFDEVALKKHANVAAAMTLGKYNSLFAIGACWYPALSDVVYRASVDAVRFLRKNYVDPDVLAEVMTEQLGADLALSLSEMAAAGAGSSLFDLERVLSICLEPGAMNQIPRDVYIKNFESGTVHMPHHRIKNTVLTAVFPPTPEVHGRPANKFELEGYFDIVHKFASLMLSVTLKPRLESFDDMKTLVKQWSSVAHVNYDAFGKTLNVWMKKKGYTYASVFQFDGGTVFKSVADLFASKPFTVLAKESGEVAAPLRPLPAPKIKPPPAEQEGKP
jgi:hypothetical protein